MKKISKIFPLLIVALGFMCTASTCIESFPNDMTFNIKNCDRDTIYVWNIIEKQDFDVFDEDYSLKKYPCVAIPSGEFKGAFRFDEPADLNEHFKYRPSNEDKEAKINYILILKKETFNNYSIDQLVKDRIYDALYVLTPRQIINMGYLVTYPENSDDLDN